MSANLFDSEIGYSTCGDITCGICGTAYNQGNDEKEDYSGESVVYTDFAGICVCSGCFEKVEREIFSRMDDIIPWYHNILMKQKRATEERLQKLNYTSVGCSVGAPSEK